MSREKFGKIGNLAKILHFGDFCLYLTEKTCLFIKELTERPDFGRKNEVKMVFYLFWTIPKGVKWLL
jgi:hypothetical protein